MTRVINFSSGPATLPESVLQRAAVDMLDWQGSGMSVMEMSHRGPEFTEILAHTQSLIRSLLSVPDQYAVLLLQGGAIAENAIVPMNLIGKTGQADYVVSGVWSEKSMKEAAKYGQVNLAASSKDSEIFRLVCMAASSSRSTHCSSVAGFRPRCRNRWLITSCPTSTCLSAKALAIIWRH
ncbi:MAG: aminotransferase class V-fold PLP-dependent enzyme, partial [Betaproteobacteria bacterium]|nr:aminotransferase class V-fold PLP-dependent enzyme [Betaproteobacteria bacterium]